MAKVARHVRVTGRVQGVFFRAWARDAAKQHDITGWIRNANDGSFEAHLEGEEDAVRWLVDLMYDGPSGARVDRVAVEDAELEGSASFEVRN